MGQGQEGSWNRDEKIPDQSRLCEELGRKFQAGVNFIGPLGFAAFWSFPRCWVSQPCRKMAV